MLDAVARGRRSALALAVVVGMMFALFTAGCCLDLDHAPADHVAAQAGASHDVTAGREGGQSEQDCQELVASAAVAVGSTSVPGPQVVAVAGAPTNGQTRPWAGGAGPEASPPPPPVPHLLCVMRT